MRVKQILLLSSLSLLFVNCTNRTTVPQKDTIKKYKIEKKEVIEKKIDYSLLQIKPSPNDEFFIREYTYKASDDDSKNSSRKKAILELKTILSEEIGTHIESSLEMNTKSSNVEDYNYLKSEIKTLSVAITKLKILDEKWNGEAFYVKARVRVNPEQTLELLQQSVKAKSSKEDIKKLNILILNQKSKLKEINRQITLREFIDKDSKKNNSLEFNLGYLMNQKYACIKIGIINGDNFLKVNKSNQNLLRFYIDSNNVLHTENELSMSNQAPHIYLNKDKQMTLYVKNDKRYLFVSERVNLKTSSLFECVETKYWNIIK